MFQPAPAKYYISSMPKRTFRTLAAILALAVCSFATEQSLSLSLTITPDYLVIGANGSFMPKVHYTGAPDSAIKIVAMDLIKIRQNSKANDIDDATLILPDFDSQDESAYLKRIWQYAPLAQALQIAGFKNIALTIPPRILQREPAKQNAQFISKIYSALTIAIPPEKNGLLGGGAACIAKPTKAAVIPPAKKDIKIQGIARDKSQIIKIIQQRTPGLRHIYNKALKQQPGLKGTIILELTIAANGKISEANIIESSTQNSDFDSKIKESVANWEFSTEANDTHETKVTYPITFSE